jgi:hypothetical protein
MGQVRLIVDSIPASILAYECCKIEHRHRQYLESCNTRNMTAIHLPTAASRSIHGPSLSYSSMPPGFSVVETEPIIADRTPAALNVTSLFLTPRTLSARSAR